MSDRVQEMARLYQEQGLSYAQIAEEFGVSRQRVGQLLGPLGLARERGQRAQITREQRLREAYARVEGGEDIEKIATELGYASGASMSDCWRVYGLMLTALRTDPDHGTLARYQSRRLACRCDECRRANRDRTRSLRGQEPPSHGASGYTNYGCRCKTCTEANRVSARSRRAAKRQRREVTI